MGKQEYHPGSYWNVVPFAALIHAASASGNWKAMMPAFQPPFAARSTHVPSVVGSMKPVVASAALPGFPSTSLLISNPCVGISSSAEPLNGAPAVVTRPGQSVYRSFWL